MTEEEIRIAVERAIISLGHIEGDIDRILDAGWGDAGRRGHLKAAWDDILKAANSFKLARELGLD